MTEQELQFLKYPIGQFDCPSTISKAQVESWISILEHFPKRLENLVINLSDKQLDTPYRDQGWTIRQVLHHLSDSHHHSYIRFKWALTEDNPVIKAYDEQAWAELIDAKTAPIQMALDHLKSTHCKLVYALKMLTMDDLNKSFIHPEGHVKVDLKSNIGNYAWHSNHHYTHIENLLKRKGWV